MKTIPLTQGKVALVDDQDFEELNRHKWYAQKDRHTYYAERGVWDGTTTKKVLIHIEVQKLHGCYEPGKQVDHRNRNGLDNRSHNLRMATNRQNSENSCKNTSGYPGVCWVSSRQKWVAQAQLKGRNRFIGYFKDPWEAVITRQKFLQDIGNVSYPVVSATVLKEN